MNVEIRDPRLERVVGSSVEFEKLGTGFLFTEGPLWHPQGQFLLFSDMPGDHLRRWSAADGVTNFRKPCNQSNGLTWDRQGRLLALRAFQQPGDANGAGRQHHNAGQPLQR